MIGTDGFQEADTVGITRPCTKHNWLVKETDALASTLHQAFHVATSGRPGPVLIDIPKDVQFANGTYGLPVATGTITADFTCIVPRSLDRGAQDIGIAPGRLAVYGHGLLGSRGEVDAG